MFNFLKNYKGTVTINDANASELANFDFSNALHIKLRPQAKASVNHATERSAAITEKKVSASTASTNKQYLITVKKYMTQPATPSFDFMKNWNNNIPMPLRTMVGEIVKETPGMYYMILHGDIVKQIIPMCMKCGKPLTNPVSQYFGMGPECGGHNYVSPFDSDEELHTAVEAYKQKLQKIVWEGWVIKKAIETMEEV